MGWVRTSNDVDQGYSFTISESYTPQTIPLERLAAYIAGVARLLGESTNVHLDMIEEVRSTWQFFRDRRPETYGKLVEL